MKLLYGLSLIVIMATVTETLWLLHHKHEAHAHPVALQLTPAPVVTQLHRAPTIAPVTVAQPAAELATWSPWINEQLTWEGDWRARDRRMAKKAYDVFTTLAHLSDKQREEFDAILRESNRQWAEMSLRVMKEDLGADGFNDGVKEIDRAGYAKVRALLRDEQWDVFSREIGKSLGFVATYLQ